MTDKNELTVYQEHELEEDRGQRLRGHGQPVAARQDEDDHGESGKDGRGRHRPHGLPCRVRGDDRHQAQRIRDEEDAGVRRGRSASDHQRRGGPQVA